MVKVARVARVVRWRLEEGAGMMAREERGVQVGGSSKRAARWLLMPYIRYSGVIYSLFQTLLKS